MAKENFKRIAVIGLPGSGKSTFASKLGQILNIPVHHLDKYVFEGNKKRNRQEFLSFKEALVKEDAWIIEGCSITTLEMRFARADTIIYFNFPRWLCLWRLSKRLFFFDKCIEETGCLRGINWPLIKYMWNFDRNKRQYIEHLCARYPHVDFLTFNHFQDPDNYLKKIKGQHEEQMF